MKKTIQNDKPYIELLPGAKAHRDFINDAVINCNFPHLAALHNRIHLPIHIVSNWFYYAMMTRESKKEVVIVYTAEQQEKREIFAENQ